ncbi:MAG: hypothetical protein KDB21_04125, partial [Acidimicrobiales bacterium]|nr:hypothetical protein [Acidimicrobiales bacterium]
MRSDTHRVERSHQTQRSDSAPPGARLTRRRPRQWTSRHAKRHPKGGAKPSNTAKPVSERIEDGVEAKPTLDHLFEGSGGELIEL